ncbi:hypothetical protein JCM19037_1593 [Geomicrobium sp. JCM 19037]|uniref:hypothetical protein n=1 Tax=Geomicrobium sp. JCM 19037 TaxID=1460634 RepID=UPI00045F2A2C|nr:hypothetical protein [Geomicrobium sp. JCM 19037]GAK03281.1 hypothetical protein JCM19037_1593 [Geomicrobium sp. JCM 19037]
MVKAEAELLEHDGKLWRKVDRDAKEGELIIIVDASDVQQAKPYEKGTVMTVVVNEIGGLTICKLYGHISRYEYAVLEPYEIHEAPTEIQAQLARQQRHLEALEERLEDVAELAEGNGLSTYTTTQLAQEIARRSLR